MVSATGAAPPGTAWARQDDAPTVIAEPGSALHQRVTRLRHDGATVTLMTLDQADQPRALRVATRTPGDSEAERAKP